MFDLSMQLPTVVGPSKSDSDLFISLPAKAGPVQDLCIASNRVTKYSTNMNRRPKFGQVVPRLLAPLFGASYPHDGHSETHGSQRHLDWGAIFGLKQRALWILPSSAQLQQMLSGSFVARGFAKM